MFLNRGTHFAGHSNKQYGCVYQGELGMGGLNGYHSLLTTKYIV